MNIPPPDYREKDLILYLGNCLNIMGLLIQYNIKVDAVITDPPYGTTSCKWDSVISFNEMWTKLKQLRNEKTPVVLFGSEPYSSELRHSNIKEFKYDWIWNKKLAGNGILAKHQPLKIHEMISVFYAHNYFPCMTKGKLRKKMTGSPKICELNNGDGIKRATETFNDDYYPNSIIEFSLAGVRKGRLHPTQKSLELIEYLIKTYTNEGDTVLDFTFGSGTTGVACKKLNRKFIGIEKDKTYFDIAVKRIQETEILNKAS